MNVRRLVDSLLALFYPKLCVGCSRPLIEQEPYLCLECLLHLPKTRYSPEKENRAMERFYGSFPINRAGSYLYYNKKGMARKIIRRIKYGRDTGLGEYISRLMAEDLLQQGFFEEIDALLPVPLHPRRKRERGFNQAEVIAQSISEVTGIPLITDRLVRAIANPSQTKKSSYERWTNTQGIFQLKRREEFPYRNILLVDDVLTTGSTLLACALCFEEIEGIKVNILTLAIA